MNRINYYLVLLLSFFASSSLFAQTVSISQNSKEVISVNSNSSEIIIRLVEATGNNSNNFEAGNITLTAPKGFVFCAGTVTRAVNTNEKTSDTTITETNSFTVYNDTIYDKTEEIVLSGIYIKPINNSTNTSGNPNQINVKYTGIDSDLGKYRSNLSCSLYASGGSGTFNGYILKFGEKSDPFSILIKETLDSDLLQTNNGISPTFYVLTLTPPNNMVFVTDDWTSDAIVSYMGANSNVREFEFNKSKSGNNIVYTFQVKNTPTFHEDKILINNLRLKDSINTGGTNGKIGVSLTFEGNPYESFTANATDFKSNTPQITKFITDTTKIYCEHGSDITFDITIKEPNAGSDSPYNTYDKICLVDQNNQVIDFLSASTVNSFIKSQVSTVKFTTDKLTHKHTSVKALLINNNPAGAQTMSLS